MTEAEWLARWEDEEDGRRAHPMPLDAEPVPRLVGREPAGNPEKDGSS